MLHNLQITICEIDACFLVSIRKNKYSLPHKKGFPTLFLIFLLFIFIDISILIDLLINMDISSYRLGLFMTVLHS